MKIKKLSTGQISVLEDDGTTRIKGIQADSEYLKDEGQNTIVIYGKTTTSIPVSQVTATIINEVETEFNGDIDDLMAIFDTFFFRVNGESGTVDYSTVNAALKFEITRAFNTALMFDYDKNNYSVHDMVGNITITFNTAGAKDVATALIALKAGTGTPTFPANCTQIGNAYDPTQYMINYAIILKQGDHFTCNFYDTFLDAPAPPEDQALTILTTNQITKTGNNYAADGGASAWSAVCVFNQYFADGVEADVVFDFPLTSITQGLMVGLSSSNTNHKYSEAPNYYGAYIQNGAPTMFSLPAFTPELDVAQNSKIKISRTAANNLKLEYAANGVTYVTREDFGTVTGILYIHVNLQATGVTVAGLIGHNLVDL